MLARTLKHLGLALDARKIDRSLARLELGYIIGRDIDGNFVYKVPLFREMIMKENPGAKLEIEINTYNSL